MLTNQNKMHSPNWVFPEAVFDIYCGDTHPSRKNICRLKTNPADPNGPMVTPFVCTWIERGLIYNNYNMVLCPRFFEQKTSLEYILYHTKMGDKDPSNATEYKSSWGHTIYHELAHADPIIAGFETFDLDYRACPVAKLVNQNGCSPPTPPLYTPPGWDNTKNGPASSLINADSYAFFASGVYFQNALKLSEPAYAINDCGIYQGMNFKNFTLDDPEGYLLAPANRTDGTYDLKQPDNPAPENTPPDDPPTPPAPYTVRPLPTDLKVWCCSYLSGCRVYAVGATIGHG